MIDLEKMFNGLFGELNGALSDIKELQGNLFRDLNSDEVLYVLEHGKCKFLSEKLKMDKEDYDALFDLKKILSAYCGKNESEYDKVVKSISLYSANKIYAVLNELCSSLVGKMQCVEDKPAKCFEDQSVSCTLDNDIIGDAVANTEVKEHGLQLDRTGLIAKTLAEVLNAVPEDQKMWLEEYKEIDPNCTEIIGLLGDLEDDSVQFNFEEIYSYAIDLIKDVVVKHYANIAYHNKGVKYSWSLELVDEVAEYLYKTKNNISISVRNNNIVVR